MGMYLMCASAVVRNEIEQGLKQKDIAETWAMALYAEYAGGIKADWGDIKAAIAEKWGKKAVDRVGAKGWKIYEQRASQMRGQT